MVGPQLIPPAVPGDSPHEVLPLGLRKAWNRRRMSGVSGVVVQIGVFWEAQEEALDSEDRR